MSDSYYISIGNSDDKLSQMEWSAYWSEVDLIVQHYAVEVHGVWVSLPNTPYQNACWCVTIHMGHAIENMRGELKWQAKKYKQDSIAFATAETEFLR
jgi:hypothetical protein